MRLSQSAPVPSPKGGNGLRLGSRTPKKHKRLDAISEDVFNQNHRDKIESNEGTSKGDDSELRRSSRVRRAPTVLDASPPPPRKRRKINKVGKKTLGVSGRKSRGKGKVVSEADSSSSESSDDEELGAWRSRLRCRVKKVDFSLKGSRNQRRGKRKLFQDEEEDDEEVGTVKDELGGNNGGDYSNSKVMKSSRAGGFRSLIGHSEERSLEEDTSESLSNEEKLHDDHSVERNMEDSSESLGNDEKLQDDHSEERNLEDSNESLSNEEKLHDDHLEGRGFENSSETLRNEDNGDCALSTREGIHRNEEIVEDGPVHPVENDSEVPMDVLEQEKHNTNDNSEDCAVNDGSSNSSKSVKDQEDGRVNAEIPSVHGDTLDDQGCNDEVNVVENEVKGVEQKNDAKVESCNVIINGFLKPRIKEGRRCGLCGGGIDGKPPKRLANDSAGSEHEEYSGSSASEEVSYDAWDGFGDEPGWLGRLLGPINDRYGIAGIWVHQHCAVWSPEVYFAGLGCLKNVRAALCRGRALKCTRCGRPGATLGCRVDRCPRTYHLPCARASGCIFDHRKFLIACADHRYLFQPHGHQYVQHIKKLKAKKMKLEIRKVSNDASRKDIEAEEKWMEKCGEDEEFLKRETKRLQRDLSRIAPVYIGGSHSQGDNLFDGWESVAGLQDVIKCMKEVVILPLLYPDFFENMGITPPRGVLLHGYPGTGKTLVVRALIGACARGDKRIAYFARKGADCLGKYVGDAERQLRLLFQVAEKSQPSVIFFDEIDGLAPARTRQQDQTHSSVVSTLLALMDGLKSRGSVIVIGATNRPDAVDPALRRPGRFDREIYFPLPSVKDRAAILALHTRKWPKPVGGPLLDWVASKTVGFAGADLQALCAQAAVIALKRNCYWQQILASAENNYEGKRPLLPSFTVEERDWFEALSLAPPPCSRREAGMAASEVVGSPLHTHLIPCLLEPLLSLTISLYLDERLWLPPRLVNAAMCTKKALVSVMEKRSLPSDRWWFYALSMVQESSTRREIVNNLFVAGILDGDASFTRCDLPPVGSCEDSTSLPCTTDLNPSGSFRNLCFTSSKKAGHRILIAGDPRSGQKHLASCFLYCFVGNVEMIKIDLATISQEGHGDMELGISHILMKCANKKLSAVFMPRIDLWAIQSIQKNSDAPPSSGSCTGSSQTSPQSDREKSNSMPSKSESTEAAKSHCGPVDASHTWKSFVEQLQCICESSSLIILATSELPCAELPHEVRKFFGGDPVISEGSIISKHATPRFTVDLKGEFDRGMLIDSSAFDLSRDLIQQFIHLVHYKNHSKSDCTLASKSHHRARDDSNQKLVEEPRVKQLIPEGSVTNTPSPLGSRPGKGKSTLAFAISTFGYQILTYPHFAELCWVTSKLKEGPNADIRGPWKGWPFNSCIVRPCKLMQKETVVSNSNNIKGKDKYTLVRGLIAVGLSAYRGIYTTPTEVSLEVRKLLELLVLQIEARIQSGKDRYQFIRLLSQVSFLEDMVNNWAHSLKSFEIDAQITPMITKISSVESPDNSVQTPADHPVQIGERSNIPDNSFQEPDLLVGLQESIAQCSRAANAGSDNVTEPHTQDETLSNKLLDHNAPGNCFSGEAAKSGNASPERVILVNRNPMPVADLDGSAIVDPSCLRIFCEGNDMERESLRSEHAEDLSINNQSPEESRALTCNQSNGEKVDYDIFGQARKHISDAHVADFNLPSKNTDSSMECEVVCAYSCCIECILSLHEVVKKLVTQAWDLSGSPNTVEDAHDLVSSLSTTLCSTIRNLYLSSDDQFTKLIECACHQGKDFSKEPDPLFYDQPGFVPRYVFRDGVLIAADSDKEFSCHCKYETLSLSSLIDLVVMAKHPSD